MKLYKKQVMIGVVLLAMLAVLTGCGDKTPANPRDAIYEKIDVQSKKVDVKKIAKQVKDGDYQAAVIEIEVEMPDYYKHFENCCERVPQEMKEGESFIDALLRLASQEAKKDKATTKRTIEINVLEAESDYSKWSDKDLDSYVKAIALEKAVDEFCMSLVAQTAPEIIIE